MKLDWDIAIENVQESITDTGRQLQITVANKGYEKIDAAKLAIYSDSVQGEVLADINITQPWDAGEKSVLGYDIAENSLGSDPLQPNLYHLVVETDADEANYSNNEKDVYMSMQNAQFLRAPEMVVQCEERAVIATALQ